MIIDSHAHVVVPPESYKFPVTGSAVDPTTGLDFDDLKPVIEGIDFLTEQDKRNVFECNCTRLYSRFKV